MNTNMIDYLKWRGDLSFTLSPFNEVDALLLSTLSYIFFDRIDLRVKRKEGLSIKELAFSYQAARKDDVHYLRKKEEEDEMLLMLCGDSRRFADCRVCAYLDLFDKKKAIQFATMCFRLAENLPLYIAFRGTDTRLVSWKEDFNLSFSIVPAQHYAAAYLKEILQLFPDTVWVGGHSKGGNLACYSCACCPDSLYPRILKIYNHDGPGFDKTLVQSDNFTRLQDKLITYLPQGSIIGMCMEQCSSQTYIIESVAKGIEQHNPYNWHIQQTHFFYKDELYESSLKIKELLDKWRNSLSIEQRYHFIDSFYKMIMATDSETIYDLGLGSFFSNLKDIYKVYHDMDEPEKNIFRLGVKNLLEASGVFLPWNKTKKDKE